MGDTQLLEEFEVVHVLMYDATELDEYDDIVVRWILFKNDRFDFLTL